MAPPHPSAPADQFDELTESEFGGAVPDHPDIVSALPGVVGLGKAATEFGRVIDIGDRYLGLSTAGQGEQMEIARALEEYTPLGIECVTTVVNDLLADGLTPVCFITHLTSDDPDPEIAEPIARGIAEGAEQAGILLLGGEQTSAPSEVSGLDVVGTAAGVAEETELFPGEAAIGDRLVGFPTSGVHPNCQGRINDLLGEDVEYTDPFPGEDHETVGAALLQPTRLFTSLLDTLRESTIHAAVHLSAGGWPRLETMGEYRYSISEHFESQPVFDVVQESGDVPLEDMYRWFPMGAGFVVAAPESTATEIAAETDGEIIGAVERGSGVRIRGMELKFEDE